MATIGGLSNGTSSGVSMYGASIKGYSGLASGLDTDSMIEGMTQGTRTKIQNLLKKKDTYQWQMDSYRSMSSKLIAFDQKYLNVGGANSPYRASFFNKSLVTAGGSNSKYVSVSGASNGLDSMTVRGVKQLAKDASMVTNADGSIQSLNTGAIDADIMNSKLSGGSIALNYNGNTYTFNLNQDAKFVYQKTDGTYDEMTSDFSTPEATEITMNALFNSIDIKDGTGKLGSKVKFVANPDGSGDKTTFSLERSDATGSTDTLNIVASSPETLKAFGFMDSDGKLVNNGLVAAGGKLDGTAFDIGSKKSLAETLAGKTMTFNYNGVAKTIKFPKAGEDGYTKLTGAEGMGKYLQEKLDKAYGSGKIGVVNNPDNSLSFTTEDTSSILRISDADSGIMGKNGVLGIGYATTNRLNREDTLANSGLNGIPKYFGAYEIDPGTGDKVYLDKKRIYDDAGNLVEEHDTGLNTLYDAKGDLLIKINGKEIKGLTVDSTLLQLTSKINSSDAGVQINYVETADRFSMTATNHGEAGKLVFNEGEIPPGDPNAGNSKAPTDFMKHLFGGFTETKGQDAIMLVEYAGNTAKEIKRDTNSFNLDGSTFTLNGTFGYKPGTAQGSTPEGELNDKTDGVLVSGTEKISFSTAVDADKISKVIGTMIEDYNIILAEAFKEVSTKPDRGFTPLTDDQKSKLSSDEIKKLEDKAKEGILFNDPLIRSMSDQLRSAFSGSADVGTLKEMGILISSDYGANGKITFDEEAFKNAILENSDKVKELFTKPATEDTKGGFTVRLKSITESFAKKDGLPKGSLVEKAGTPLSTTSVLDNALKKQMDDIDKQVKALKSKLQTEIDRYSKQFSSLEQLIQQMNSQSSWLQQSGG